MGTRKPDARIDRTRGAIIDSFNELRSRPYGEIRVSDIVAGAGVGRSTFYEHFRGKDAVLRHAAAWALEALADAVTGEGGTGPLRHVLEHLRQNRCAARGRLAGERVCRWLAEVIEVRLATTCAQGATTIIPVRIAATQIATAQLALIRAWLSGRDPCPTDAIVDALARTSRAMATAVLP